MDDVYAPRLCIKSFGQYIPHVESTHKMYRTKLGRHMAK